MANPRFVPIDNAAKDGKYHLLRDGQQHQYCARWDGVEFVYSGGAPVSVLLLEYASRADSSAGGRAQVAAGGSA